MHQPRWFLFAAAGVFVAPLTASAVILAYDGFAYPFRFDLDSDTHQLFVNPVVGASEPAPSMTFTDPFDFARVGINADPGMLVDEFRLGQTFADVTPVPELSSILFTALGAFPLLLRRRSTDPASDRQSGIGPPVRHRTASPASDLVQSLHLPRSSRLQAPPGCDTFPPVNSPARAW